MDNVVSRSVIEQERTYQRLEQTMDILIDLYQQQRIGEAQRKAEAATDAAKRLAWQVEDLQRKTDALTIASQALWDLLRDTTGLTDAMVLQKMEEIDMRDGRKDGKISPRTRTCPQCRRKSNAGRAHCLYCGSDLSKENLFETA